MEQSDQSLSKAQRRQLKKERQRLEQQSIRRKQQRKKILLVSIWAVGIFVLLFIIGLAISNRKILPPTTMTGHIEVSPESHFLSRPMDVRVHKHMLEHADGSGPPGVVINYNCDDFDCEPDFLDNLKSIVDQYPQHVYAAPFPNMSAKLVLTRLGKQEILNGFDEEKIKAFVEN